MNFNPIFANSNTSSVSENKAGQFIVYKDMNRIKADYTDSESTIIDGVPSGVILMWHGDADSVPSGYAICNGDNGTPDLRDRFIVAAGNSYQVNETGGSASVTLTIDQIAQHNHTIPEAITTSGTGGGHYLNGLTNEKGVVSTTDNTGGGQSHENRPPYYALYYIMKL